MGPMSLVIWDQMEGWVKRAHANDLKLDEVDGWEVTEPNTKKARMRWATLVDLKKKMEPDEDSKEEEKGVGQQSVETFGSEPGSAV